MDGQEKKFERVNQKRRTRVELLRAARELIERGNQNPSVGDVADHAKISRATAYRYFSASDEMIREAVLDGVADAIEVPPADEGDGAEQSARRLDTLVAQVFQMVVENEAVFRALLATSATGQSNTRRGGRRLTWLREALSPLQKQMSSKHFDRLVNSLSLLTGIEALVVTRDICELGNKEAESLLRWTAKALFTAAVSESIGS
jgi:AcrR family transcriptional regulator